MRKEEETGEENPEFRATCYTVYEEKRRCVVNHHFEVDSQRHEGKYQRFILARAWTRLIKDGTFDD